MRCILQVYASFFGFVMQAMLPTVNFITKPEQIDPKSLYLIQFHSLLQEMRKTIGAYYLKIAQIDERRRQADDLVHREKAFLGR